LAKGEIYNKILIIRFSSLGDVILTTPLVDFLKTSYPDAKIDYCTKEEFSGLLKNNPSISDVITVEGKFDFPRLKKLKNLLVSRKYDLVIDAHRSLRTFYLRLFLRSSSRVLKFSKYSLRKFMLVKFKINLMKNIPPVVVRYLEILRPAAETQNNKAALTPKIYTDNASVIRLNELFTESGLDTSKKIITIAPASKHHTKSFPPEKYVQLIEKIDSSVEIVLTGKGNDSIHIDQIAGSSNRKLHNFCDKLSLPELAELIRRSSVFISGDTGPMHIAEAFNTPLIMLAGSSVKEFGFYPQNMNKSVFEVNGLPCRPCSHIGRSKCPKGHFKCMNDISIESILDVIDALSIK
jgi:lipopolysaccharide heptosyltransferase II